MTVARRIAGTDFPCFADLCKNAILTMSSPRCVILSEAKNHSPLSWDKPAHWRFFPSRLRASVASLIRMTERMLLGMTEKARFLLRIRRNEEENHNDPSTQQSEIKRLTGA